MTREAGLVIFYNIQQNRRETELEAAIEVCKDRAVRRSILSCLPLRIQHKNIDAVFGQFSEDTQESRNKDYKKIRLHHARECSRSTTNEDVFRTLPYTPDPYISSIRKTYIRHHKSVKEFDEDIVDLLKVNELILEPEVQQV